MSARDMASVTATELHGVLSPNDTLARAALTVVIGQDSEVESVKSIMAGEEFATVYKDTRTLVAETIQVIEYAQQGGALADLATDTESYDNGVKIVPAILLEPMTVTRTNAAETYADDELLAPLTH